MFSAKDKLLYGLFHAESNETIARLVAFGFSEPPCSADCRDFSISSVLALIFEPNLSLLLIIIHQKVSIWVTYVNVAEWLL